MIRSWPIIYAIIAVMVVVGLVFGISYCSKAHGAEMGPAGAWIVRGCGTHDAALNSVVAPPYSEELWRQREAHFASGKYAGVVEWTENLETGTWTVFVSKNGLTCMLFSGMREGAKT